MRLLCFAFISSDLIENCPVSNNRTRQKYDRLAWEAAGDTCVCYNRHERNMSPVFLWKAKCAFKEEMAHTLLSLFAQQATMVCPRLRSCWGQSCQTFNFSPKKILSNFQLFFSKNLVKFSTFYFFLENLVKLSIRQSTFSSENLIKLSTFLFQLLLQWGVSPWCFKPLSNKTGRNEWWRRRPFTISKRTWVLSL